MPRNTTAPAGTGRTIDPTIVAMNIVNKCHDVAVTPAGMGAASRSSAAQMTALQRRGTDIGAEYTGGTLIRNAEQRRWSDGIALRRRDGRTTFHSLKTNGAVAKW